MIKKIITYFAQLGHKLSAAMEVKEKLPRNEEDKIANVRRLVDEFLEKKSKSNDPWLPSPPCAHTVMGHYDIVFWSEYDAAKFFEELLQIPVSREDVSEIWLKEKFLGTNCSVHNRLGQCLVYKEYYIFLDRQEYGFFDSRMYEPSEPFL